MWKLSSKLRSQAFDGEEGSDSTGPAIVIDKAIRRLVASVLVRAIQDSLGIVPKDGDTPEYKSRQMSREAKEWIDEDEVLPFGFIWCCNIVELDPIRLRRCIDRIKTRLFKAEYFKDGGIRTYEQKPGNRSRRKWAILASSTPSQD